MTTSKGTSHLSLVDTVQASTDIPGVIEADPEDEKYLTAALEGRAQYIVTGDNHLLDLEEYEGIKILPPADFLLKLSD